MNGHNSIFNYTDKPLQEKNGKARILPLPIYLLSYFGSLFEEKLFFTKRRLRNLPSLEAKNVLFGAEKANLFSTKQKFDWPF